MQPKTLAKLLIALLLHLSLLQTGLAAEPAPANQPSSPKLVEFKHKIVSWGTNKNVQVQLLSQEKLAGRVAKIQDESFVLQTVDNGQITSRTVPYAELKSLKAKGNGVSGKAFTFGLLGGLAAVATFIALAFALTGD